MPSMSSYLLENLVLNYFEEKGEASQFVDLNVINILQYIKTTFGGTSMTLKKSKET